MKITPLFEQIVASVVLLTGCPPAEPVSSSTEQEKYKKFFVELLNITEGKLNWYIDCHTGLALHCLAESAAIYFYLTRII